MGFFFGEGGVCFLLFLPWFLAGGRRHRAVRGFVVRERDGEGGCWVVRRLLFPLVAIGGRSFAKGDRESHVEGVIASDTVVGGRYILRVVVDIGNTAELVVGIVYAAASSYFG